MTWGNVFLKLTLARAGKVDGESTATDYKGLIEVKQFGLGIDLVTEASTFDSAAEQLREKFGATLSPRRTARSVTRAHLRDLTFSKRFDIASPVLLKALNTQEQITEALFTVLRRGETATGVGVPLLGVKLNFGFVESINLKTPTVGNLMVVEEDVTLRYREISIDYYAGPGGSKAMNFSHNKG